MLTPADVHHFNNQSFSFENLVKNLFKNMKGAKVYASENVSLIR